MSMKTFIKFQLFLLAFLVIGILQSVFGQETTYPNLIVSNQKDTMMCFSMDQVRELTIRNERLKYVTEILDITNKELIYKDSLFRDQLAITEEQEVIIRNQEEITSLTNSKLDMLALQNQSLSTEVKKYKRRSIVAYSVAVVFSSAIVYICNLSH